MRILWSIASSQKTPSCPQSSLVVFQFRVPLSSNELYQFTKIVCSTGIKAPIEEISAKKEKRKKKKGKRKKKEEKEEKEKKKKEKEEKKKKRKRKEKEKKKEKRKEKEKEKEIKKEKRRKKKRKKRKRKRERKEKRKKKKERKRKRKRKRKEKKEKEKEEEKEEEKRRKWKKFKKKKNEKKRKESKEKKKMNQRKTESRGTRIKESYNPTSISRITSPNFKISFNNWLNQVFQKKKFFTIYFHLKDPCGQKLNIYWIPMLRLGSENNNKWVKYLKKHKNRKKSFWKEFFLLTFNQFRFIKEINEKQN